MIYNVHYMVHIVWDTIHFYCLKTCWHSQNAENKAYTTCTENVSGVGRWEGPSDCKVSFREFS